MEKPLRKQLTIEQAAAAEKLKSIWLAKKKTIGITQEKAAQALGITQGAVYQFLNGRTPLNLENVLKFSALLECSPLDIYPDIVPYVMREQIKEGFTTRDQRDKDVLKVAEEILSLPKSQQVAIRAYFQAITDDDQNEAG